MVDALFRAWLSDWGRFSVAMKQHGGDVLGNLTDPEAGFRDIYACINIYT